MTADRALSMLVYGPSRAGKSTFAMTSPAPRLILDVEASSRFLPGAKIYWDPLSGPPPEYIPGGAWDTCIVPVTSWQIVGPTYDWLKSGRHQFKSVIVDSISEVQNKTQEAVNGREQMKIQHWGELYTRLSFFGRDLRDLTHLPNNSIEAVVITAMDQFNPADGSHRPLLQGSIANVIPYWYDINGYFYAQQEPNPVTGEPEIVRHLFIGNNPSFVAGSRAPGLPDDIARPNIQEIINTIFGPVPE